MDAKVGGLRAVQRQGAIEGARRNRPIEAGQAQEVSLRPAASPINRYHQPAQAPSDRRAEQLANALSSLNPKLVAFASDSAQEKLKAQEENFRVLVEQFKQDYEGGAVTAAQVRERMPETVPVIASRIAESMGHDYGSQVFSQVIAEINASDNLRKNTEARQMFLNDARERIFKEIGEGRGDLDFYANGVLAAIDKQVQTHELNWQRETAEYHQKVQTNRFASEVMDYVATGGDLTALDKDWKYSSSLSNEERNNTVFNTVAEMAYRVSDPSMLDKIPDRFLNAERKLKVAEYKDKIEAKRWADFRNQRSMEDFQREEQTRQRKVDILTRLSNNEDVDLAEFKDDPDSMEFVLKHRESKFMSPAQSKYNVTTVRRAVLNAATTGNLRELGGIELNEKALSDFVLNDAQLTPDDRKALIEEIPKLLDGVNVMRDDRVRGRLENLNAAVLATETSLGGQLAVALKGRNFRYAVTNTYERTITSKFYSHYEETGSWPVGHQIEAYAKEAEAEAIEAMDRLVKLTPMVKSTTETSGQNRPSRRNQQQNPVPTEINGVTIKKVE